MIVSDQAVINLLKEPRSRELNEADDHENRLRLHGERTDKAPTDNPAYEDFIISYPSALLPKDKATVFKALLTWPLPTVSLVGEVYGELSKVFEGQNKVFEFYFKDEEKLGDFQEYRQKIKEPTFWQIDAWQLVQTKINSVIAIDLSLEQNTTAPEPRFFVIPVCSIHAILNDPITNSCEFLIWKTDPSSEERLAQIVEVAFTYDDATYRMLHRREGMDEFEVVLTVPHLLEYTPARMLWTDKLRKSSILKQAPHSPQLGDVDWILYQTICSRNLELYAGFPIVTTYQEQCDYQNSDGFSCEDGFIFRFVGDIVEGIESRREKVACPSCSNRVLVGPGSVKEVPAPLDSQSANLMPAVEVTKGDVDSLEWFADDLDMKISEFNQSVTGKGSEPKNDQAKNEKQVAGDFENRQAILARVALNLEQIQKFTLDTIALLRYGKEQYQGSIISYGTKFFLQSEKEVLESYQAAKTEGLPNYILENRRIAMLQKTFKNDPLMMARVQILDMLEPLPDYTSKEIDTMTFVSRETLGYKVHFNDLIKRFELENDDIVKWRGNVDMKVKIAAIDKILREYLEDLIPDETVEVPLDENGKPSMAVMSKQESRDQFKAGKNNKKPAIK